MCSLARARVMLPFLVPKEPRTPLPPGERGQCRTRVLACRRRVQVHTLAVVNVVAVDASILAFRPQEVAASCHAMTGTWPCRSSMGC